MAFEPDTDHGHAHAHGTGVKWLDISVGLSAMFISVVSLVVSIQHGRTMEQMVDQNERLVVANTMPILKFYGVGIDDRTDAPMLSLDIRNGGVGPAVINWFAFRYKGVSYGDLESLTAACCATAGQKPGRLPQGVFYSNVSDFILPARETISPITITPKAAPDVLAAFQTARQYLSAQACYCSVLNECWLTDFGPGRPSHVKSCDVPKDVKPW